MAHPRSKSVALQKSRSSIAVAAATTLLTLLGTSCKTRAFNAAREARTSSVASRKVTFDVNDVSILFPPPATTAQRDQMVPLTDVIDEATFKSVIAAATRKKFFSNEGSKLKTNYAVAGNQKLWRIVGVRADHCFMFLAEKPDCSPQLRFVAQPIAIPGTDFTFPTGSDKLDNYDGTTDPLAFDDTMHVVYELPPDRFASLATELAELKSRAGRETSGTPLGVHPAFKSGDGKAFSSYLNSLIRKYAQSRAPSGIAIMAGLDGVTFHDHGGAWTFAIGRVSAGKFTALPKLPLVNGPHLTISQNLEDGDSTDPILAGDGKSTFTAMTGSSDTQKIYELLTRAANPRLTAQSNTDCATCHQTHVTDTLDLSDAQRTSLDASFGYKIPAGVTPKIDDEAAKATRPSYAFRNFGFLEDKPFVSRRTLNETMEVAAALSKMNLYASGDDVTLASLQASAVKVAVSTPQTETNATKRCVWPAGEKIRGKLLSLKEDTLHWKIQLAEGSGPAGCGIAGEAFLYGPHAELIAEGPGAPLPPGNGDAPGGTPGGAPGGNPAGSAGDTGAGASKCTVKVGGARAFSAASFSASVLMTVPAGTALKKTGTSGSFVQVDLEGKVAFVSAGSVDCAL